MSNNEEALNAKKSPGNKKKTKVRLYTKRIRTKQPEKNVIEELLAKYENIDVSQITKFPDFPLSSKTLKGLKESGYLNPTDIQRETILLGLQGKDILGAAQTGSGKTLAFLIPLLEVLYCKQWTNLDGIGALVITPTRELAYQIFECLCKVGKYHDFSAGLIIGGKDLKFEKKRMDQCNIIICTPGRLLQHMDENPLFDCVNMQCVKNPIKKINLPHNEMIYLGRNEETMITDTALSRKQIAAKADYNNYLVAVESLGVNYSACNGYALRKGGTYQLRHGDRVELRIGYHEFDVFFHPEPYCNEDTNNEIIEPDKKRLKPNFPIFNLTKSPNSKDSSMVDTKVNSNDNAVCCSGIWESVDAGELLIYTFMQVKSRAKIAAFDLDGTIIKTKSGSRFAKTPEDWTLNFSEIPQKLKDLYDEDYKIVIFTNQGGVKMEKTKIRDLKSRIESVLTHIKVPIQVFAATTKCMYRKPAPGMWNALCNEKNDSVDIDILNSFYVGDAAGRDKNWAPKKNKDHSVGDRLFAINIGLQFYTPEEYFLGARSVPYSMPKFDPKNLKCGNESTPISSTCEVIVMVGSPGSGKSYYCKEYLVKNGYAYANRDLLGSWQACVKVLEKSIQHKQSVVIDNTNPDKLTRKRYVDAAKKFNIPSRCFLMTTSLQHCKHNNRFRELTDKNHSQVGEVIINMFKKHFEEPTLAEGFEQIVKIDCIPKFDNDEHEKLYKMFLLES